MTFRAFRRLLPATLLFAAAALRVGAAEPKAAVPPPAVAAAKAIKTPEATISEAVDKVIAVLSDASLKGDAKKKERQEKIRKIMLSSFDMNRMSESCLGSYKSKFTPQQFTEFADVFSKLLFATYIVNIEKYTDEKVKVSPAKPEAKGVMVVQTKVISGSSEIPIDYKLVRVGAEWKGYDVLVEGVSLIKNYRSQFRDILMKKDAAYLLDKLRKKVASDEK